MTVAVPEHDRDIFVLTLTTGSMASAVNGGPLEIPTMGMEPCLSSTSAIQATLTSLSASALALTRVPARVHADRPLDFELAGVGLGADAGASLSVANRLSAHARVSLEMY